MLMYLVIYGLPIFWVLYFIAKMIIAKVTELSDDEVIKQLNEYASLIRKVRQSNIDMQIEMLEDYKKTYGLSAEQEQEWTVQIINSNSPFRRGD